MTNKELINYLHYLLDKIDPLYYNEVNKSIKKLIKKLEK